MTLELEHITCGSRRDIDDLSFSRCHRCMSVVSGGGLQEGWLSGAVTSTNEMWLLTQNRDFPVMKIENNAVLEFDHFPSLQANLLKGLHSSVSASGLSPTKQKTASVFIRVGAGGGLQAGSFTSIGSFNGVVSLQKHPSSRRVLDPFIGSLLCKNGPSVRISQHF